MKCKKVDARIECVKCQYPYSEAVYPDAEPPLSCDASSDIIYAHIDSVIARAHSLLNRRLDDNFK